MANLLRKVLTVLEIIKFFEIKNQTQVYIAALFKCNKATISKIIANKDYWKNQAEKFESYENLRPSKFDALEQALFSGLYK